MDKEALALGLTLLVHVIGAGLLIWAMFLDNDERPDLRGWLRYDDDDGGGQPPPPAPPTHGPGDGAPLPDAVPSAVRLREPGRIAEGHPRPARRPEHAPAPAPAREREPADR